MKIIDRLKSQLNSGYLLYRSNDETVMNKQVLLVDTIGILSSVNRNAHLACEIRGVEVGIHNILQALLSEK